jgi:hypothetical protein
MNIYYNLVKDLEIKFNKDPNQYLFRISMEQDLDRVKKFGSTRIGISNKLWDKLDFYPKSLFPKYPVLHEEIVIASYWNDLLKDSLIENGTLKHKLSIYEKPFFTVYKKEDLLYIDKEDSLGENNQGTHFYFLKNPKDCLDSLWQIKINNELTVEEIKWK